MAIRIGVDLTTRAIEVALEEPLFLWATAIPVELLLSRDGEPARLSEDAGIRLGFKRNANFTGALLAYIDDWTRGATDEDPYLGALDLNLANLETAMADATNLITHLQLMWSDGADAGYSKTARLQINNTLHRPSDGTPLPSRALNDAVFAILEGIEGITITQDEDGNIIIAGNGTTPTNPPAGLEGGGTEGLEGGGTAGLEG